MPKLKALKQKKSKSMKKQTEDKIEENNSDPDLDSEYQSLTNEQQVVQELCRLRDHFKKIEKFEDEEVFPPLLYISLRMYLEAVTDLEEARLEAINFLTSAIEEEFEARKYMIDHGYDQPRDSLKNLIKDKTTQIH